MFRRRHFVSVVVSLLSILLSASLQSATNASVEGVVRDAHTGDPLPGANVVLAGTGLGSSTDINGKFAIRNIPPGSYTIRATYVGYRNLEFSIEVSDTAVLTQDFSLVAVGVEGETVVVTAQAAGQTQAINLQLASPQITNVVSAARIQELPDMNAAESVGRLPGVSLIRSGGEASQVVIRGLQPKYNAIMIEGIRLASSNQDDRGMDLSMISPNMLEGIEVIKAGTPDQDADVLGGIVNFRVREAGRGEQEREGIGVNLLAQGGYNGLSNVQYKTNNYKYVGSAEGRFLESRLGVFVQGDLERRNLTSNELNAWYTHTGKSTVDYLTTSLSLDDIPRDRQRANGTLVLDYRLPEGKISFVNFLSSGVTDAQDREEWFDIPDNLLYYNLFYSRSTVNIITNGLRVEQQLPLVHANLQLSHAYSETKDPGDWGAGFYQTFAGLNSLINAKNLDPRAIPLAASTDPANTDLDYFDFNSSFARERGLTASLDLDRQVNISDKVTALFKFGGKYRYQTRSYAYDEHGGGSFNWLGNRVVDSMIASHFPSTMQYAGSVSLPIIAFTDPTYNYGRFLNGDYSMASPLNFNMLAEVARFLTQNADVIAQLGTGAYGHDAFASTTHNYSGHENQSAFYGMTTVNVGQALSIIPGVRYQNLQTTYRGPRGFQDAQSAWVYHYYDTTLTVNHWMWLPDVLVRYRPVSWFDARFAYSNTVAYPDYKAIVPRIDVATNGVIAWNNTQLVPSRSTNYDICLSFYENTVGLFTVAGFLKRIDNLIFPWDFYVSNANASPYFPPGLALNQSPQGTYHVFTYVNDRYRVDDQGLELDWQTHFWYLPHPFDGLVMNVNYTHIFSKAQYPYVDVSTVNRRVIYTDTTFTDRLLFQPDDFVNLSIGYDYEGFAARVSLMYQANVFTGPNYWPQLRTHTAASTRWDLSVKQDLPWWGVQMYGDVNNLNSADDISIIQAPTAAPQAWQSYGLTADVGIRWQL